MIMSIEKLYISLSQRKRPEDVAEMILDVLGDDLSVKETRILKKAANGSLMWKLFAYTSMLQEFAKPIGAEKQIKTVIAIFGLDESDSFDYDDPWAVNQFIESTSAIIQKTVGENDFLRDRLNREERVAAGMDISKRQYNKRWRLLKRLEKKVSKLAREIKKSEFQQIAKHGLAHRIEKEDFLKDINAACFIAYYTAKSNLRSEFTIFGQKKAYDEISDMLFQRCLDNSKYRRAEHISEGKSSTNWWAIAHVYPSLKVLNRLNDEEKGMLLGKWTSILAEIASMLEEIWNMSEIDRQSMIVRRGNDSTTWNHTAGAWNKARNNWMNLIYATGTSYILDELCFGKVMRLMAADVVAWHRIAGGGLDPNTEVWSSLPLPWEVFAGKAVCTRNMVEKACWKANVNAEESGWIAPRLHVMEEFSPTPELVHGVTVSNPFLATILKKHKFYSGKKKKPVKLKRK